MHGYLEIAPEVRDAIATHGPVVALETTIVSHGMPYPRNIETALEVESIVRARGAVPATIAVIEGRIRIGVTRAQLEQLASGSGVLKLSRADLAFAIASRSTGATTVAATMICANIVDIDIFATGGIGGVHRGAHVTMDISADIDELARTGASVVCAGAKALLDLSKTLEVLETRGVPVIGIGTAEFPAFWSAGSGLPVTMTLANAHDAAHYLQIKRDLAIGGGTLFVVPAPADAQIRREELESLIESAIAQADDVGIRGKAVTPWLLDRLYRMTGGRTLRTNIELIKNNAAVAADIAVSLAANARAHVR